MVRRPPWTFSTIQERISPSILVVPTGNSVLPQTSGPKLTIPISSNWLNSLSAILTKGPPESPTHGELPGFLVEKHSVEVDKFLKTKNIILWEAEEAHYEGGVTFLPPLDGNSIQTIFYIFPYLPHVLEQPILETSWTPTNCKILEGFWYQVCVSPQPEMTRSSPSRGSLFSWGKHIGCMKLVNWTMVFSLRSATSSAGTVPS